jgi:hypothetical protein
MAKRSQRREESQRGISDLFAQTTAQADEEKTATRPVRDRAKTGGVSLRQSEWDAYTKLAEEYGVSRNAIMGYALRYFLAEHAAGEATVEFERVRQLSNPRKQDK